MLPRAKSKRPISASERLRWDLGLDSMKLLELVFLLEEEFGWRSADSDFGRIDTVADVVGLVARLLGANEQPSTGAEHVP